MQWYYAKEGQSVGPLSDIDFRRLVRAGDVNGETLVWREGLQNWTPFSQLPSNGIGQTRPKLKLAVLEGEDTCSQCGVILPAEKLVDRFGAKLCPQCLVGADATQPEAQAAPKAAGTTANREIMAQARASLNGRWATAVGVVFVWALIEMAVSSVPIAGAIASLLLRGPLSLGLAAFFLTCARGETAPFGLLFAGFRHFVAAFLTMLLLAIFVLLWMLPSLALMGITAISWLPSLFQSAQSHAPLSLPPSLPLFGAAALLAIVTSVYVNLRYSMTYYVLATNTEAGALAAITASKQMMKGHYGKLLCLHLRFLGWTLLCLLTLGIGFLWLVPYIMTSQARFYEDIRG